MLNLENSQVTTFKVLKTKKHFYLINMLYSNLFMRLILNPSDITFEAYELTEGDYRSLLKKNNKKDASILNAVLITQPIVGVIYRMGKYFFQQIDDENKLLFKIILYLITLIIPIIFGEIVEYRAKQKVRKYVENKKKYGLRIVEKKKMNKINWGIQSVLSLFIFFGIPSYLYFKINNGAEAILLIVVSVFFLIYIVGAMSILQGPKYKQSDFEIVD